MRGLIALLVLAAIAAAIWFVALREEPAEATEDLPDAASSSSPYFLPSDRFVEIDGARVRVREQGPEDAPVVLLIHGFSFSLESFDAWADDLDRDYRVIRYDLLGHGLTGPDPETRYNPMERAAFLGSVMDSLDIDRAIIAGNSLGGLIAWRFAANHPDRVEKLILISPGGFSINGVGDTPVPVPPAVAFTLTTAPEPAIRAMMSFVYGDDALVTDEAVARVRALLLEPGNGEAMLAHLEEFTLPDPSADLRRVTSPTLILWGEADGLIPAEHGDRFASYIQDTTLILYPGVGHAAQEEAPAATLTDTRAFLDQ